MRLTKATLKRLIKEELLKESMYAGFGDGYESRTVDDLVGELSEIHRQLHEFLGFGVEADPRASKLYEKLGEIVGELQERQPIVTDDPTEADTEKDDIAALDRAHGKY